MHPLENMFLLSNGEQMYAPVCQDAAPLTDDMLREQSEAMAHLGTSPEATALRMQMQLPSLVSDIEAFKAANPGALLEDFVRWYSPRDYDSKSGLSQRMRSDGNAWVKAWNSAKSVPVSRQKKLFDRTAEGEKVLYYLSSFSLSSLVSHVMPVIQHSAIAELWREMQCLQLELPQSFDKKKLTDSKLEAIRELELLILTFKSMQAKWEHVNNLKAQSGLMQWEEAKTFLWSLCSNGPIAVSTDAERKLVIGLMRLKKKLENEEIDAGERLVTDSSDAHLFLPPTVKEFVLRADISRPSDSSRPLPQRMNCVLTDGDFLIAATLSKDISFA